MATRRKATAATNASTAYLDPGEQKRLADRLARIEGHVRSIRQMVVDRRCADEILLQVAAVKAAVNKFSSALLEYELKACVDTCMDGDSDERIDRITKVMSTLLKQS